MELRSGRRLRRSSPLHNGTASLSMDLISSLPDEILLLVLARLRCFRTAVKTCLLSRRWRGLWIGLTDLTFRGFEPARIEALFRRLAASPQVSTLDIGIPQIYGTTDTNSLLHAAVQLSPGQLVFTLREPHSRYNMGDIELPCFQCTTSIELNTRYFCVKPLPLGDFTALDSLYVTGKITDLGSFLSRCPRLRVLSISYPDKQHLLRITLPPAGEFPNLEKLSLSGKIVDLGSLLNRCQHLRVLSVTQLDTCVLRITPPTTGEFPMLEKLFLSGNIADLGTLLSHCPRLHMLSVTFSGMTLGSLEAALNTIEDSAPIGLVLSHLGIGIPWRDGVDAASFASLLLMASRILPQELVCFTDDFEGCAAKRINADLPCFPHVLSIEMRLPTVCFKPPPAGEFSALQRLSLSGPIVDIGTLVTRCPQLRILNATIATGKLTVHSTSLQKLDVHSSYYSDCNDIDIVTPFLKQLHLRLHASRDINVRISAPMVENVSWQCSYMAGSAHVFGSWMVHHVKVQTIERTYVDNMESTCSQLPLFHCLCLHMYAGNHLNATLSLAEEMGKLPVTNFSSLELNFESDLHIYGPIVLQLLQMNWISAATKNLTLVLRWCPEAKRSCTRNCLCDKPKDPTTQSIVYTSLEEVTIRGFNGEDHEHDFVREIIKCSPMLKRMTLRPSPAFDRVMVMSNISKAYPSVKFYR